MNPVKNILRYYKKVTLPLTCINFLIQRIFRYDSSLVVMKHFTSRVLCPNNIHFDSNDESIKLSFAVSGGCYFHGGNGIHIGNGTIWSSNVSIISLNHDLKNFSLCVQSNPIKIGEKCWIGTQVTILDGVVLGPNTIVGANSVVNKSFVSGNVIIAGSPARIIRNI